jgi:cell division protein FtsZ
MSEKGSEIEKDTTKNGFIIKLQPSDDNDLDEQEKIIKSESEENQDNKKQSFLSRIFGTKNKKKKEIEESKVNFFDEIREISEKNRDNLNTSTNFSNNDEPKIGNTNNELQEEEIISTENNEKENDINDDLLQIPAFLRRQAN